MSWISEAADDITCTRVICVLAEQIFISWLGTYGHNVATGQQKAFAQLSPWKNFRYTYTGTNLQPPLRADIKRSDKAATSMTPEELNKRTADIHRQRKQDWTPEEHKEAQDKRHSYHDRVARPVRIFKRKAKKGGMSKEGIENKVKAFQKAERLAPQNGVCNEYQTH